MIRPTRASSSTVSSTTALTEKGAAAIRPASWSQLSAGRQLKVEAVPSEPAEAEDDAAEAAEAAWAEAAAAAAAAIKAAAG